MPELLFRLFVYGTLKSSQRSHAPFCGTATGIEPASVLGRLYRLAAGYPMLVVPERLIAAVGTADSAADLATQCQWDAQETGTPAPRGTLLEAADRSAGSDWEPIEGEVLAFDDPRAVMPRLDDFEDFRPRQADSTYARVLVPLLGEPGRYVWTYVAPDGQLPAGAGRIHHRWP